VLAVLTEEQQMLGEMATKLAASSRVTTPNDLDAVDRTKGWRRLAESGLLSLRVRNGDGVPSATGVEVMLVAEALGGALAPLPFGGSILASDLLAMAGAPDPWLALTLNRPHALNAVGDGMHQDLTELIELVRADDSVGAILLKGEGRAFCVGGDVKAMSTNEQSPTVRVASIFNSKDLLYSLLEVQQPIICAVQGFAMVSARRSRCSATLS
jgi:hypothetical protein